MKPSRCLWMVTLLLMAVAAHVQQGTQGGEWRSYGGDLGSTGYAPLDQIDRDNFSQLELAWTRESIEGDSGRIPRLVAYRLR